MENREFLLGLYNGLKSFIPISKNILTPINFPLTKEIPESTRKNMLLYSNNKDLKK